MSLEVGRCSPSVVADLVREQVGFEVVLLDSKCFPLRDCDSTVASEFWKSNRRILAASMSLFTKLTGTSTNPIRANPDVDLTASDEELSNPPRSKRCCLREFKKLDEILERVEKISKKVDVPKLTSEAFECVI